MKAEGATSKDVFDYLFDIGVGRLLSEKDKRYLHKLLERQDPKYLQLDENFDNYLDNDGLEDIIGDERMQTSIRMTSLVSIKCSKKWFFHYCTISTSVKSVK